MYDSMIFRWHPGSGAHYLRSRAAHRGPCEHVSDKQCELCYSVATCVNCHMHRFHRTYGLFFCREELERLIAGWLAAVQTYNMVNFKDVFSDTYDVTDVFKTAVNNIRLL